MYEMKLNKKKWSSLHHRVPVAVKDFVLLIATLKYEPMSFRFEKKATLTYII